MKAYKIALPLLAATTLVCTSGGVAFAQSDEVRDAICANSSADAISADEDAEVTRLERELRDARGDRDRFRGDADRFDGPGRGHRPSERVQSLQRTLNELKAELKVLEDDSVDPKGPPDVEGGSDKGAEVTPEEAAAIKAKKEQIASVDRALDARKREQRADDRAERELVRDLKEAKDKQDDARDLEAQVKSFVGDRSYDTVKNEVCAGGVTTTPSPTTTPEPAPVVDLDCGDFPLADGRTAQQVLDSTPGEDPNGLDADLDRSACEPGQDTAADGSDLGDSGDSGSGSSDQVVVPNGGVNTGGGPA